MGFHENLNFKHVLTYKILRPQKFRASLAFFVCRALLSCRLRPYNTNCISLWDHMLGPFEVERRRATTGNRTDKNARILLTEYEKLIDQGGISTLPMVATEKEKQNSLTSP